MEIHVSEPGFSLEGNRAPLEVLGQGSGMPEPGLHATVSALSVLSRMWLGLCPVCAEGCFVGPLIMQFKEAC